MRGGAYVGVLVNNKLFDLSVLGLDFFFDVLAEIQVPIRAGGFLAVEPEVKGKSV